MNYMAEKRLKMKADNFTAEDIREEADHLDANYPSFWRTAKMLREGAEAIERMAKLDEQWANYGTSGYD